MDSILSPSADFEELESKLASSRAQLMDLATMGAVITRIQEIDAVLSVVMDMAIRLVEGEVGLIMIDDRNGLQPHISWGVDAAFIETLIAKLAWEWSEPLSKDPELRQSLLKEYTGKIAEARALDGQEGMNEPLPNGGWVEAHESS